MYWFDSEMDGLMVRLMMLAFVIAVVGSLTWFGVGSDYAVVVAVALIMVSLPFIVIRAAFREQRENREWKEKQERWRYEREQQKQNKKDT